MCQLGQLQSPKTPVATSILIATRLGPDSPRAKEMRLHLVRDDTIEPLLVPRSSLLLLDPVRVSNACLALLASGHTGAWPGHANEEVHAEDTDGRVVLDTKIDVLLDREGSEHSHAC